MKPATKKLPEIFRDRKKTHGISVAFDPGNLQQIQIIIIKVDLGDYSDLRRGKNSGTVVPFKGLLLGLNS